MSIRHMAVKHQRIDMIAMCLEAGLHPVPCPSLDRGRVREKMLFEADGWCDLPGCKRTELRGKNTEIRKG